MANVENERRKFKRVNAPMFCRPVGRVHEGNQQAPKLDVKDVSLGGLRVYTDDNHRIGERLELELFLPESNGVTLEASVVWVDRLENGPARFEVGLQFVDVAKEDLARLEAVLKEA